MNGSTAEPVLLPGERLEPLARGVSVIVGGVHTFNTDTILLAVYSLPRKGEICADFGTGSGTIPLVWCARADPAFVGAVELQEDACSMLERSAALNGLTGKIRVIREDIKNLPSSGALPRGGLDRIACNPPYKSAGTGIQSEDGSARLARHETACGFSDIAAAASSLLRWGGRFFFCMRPERLCETLETLRAAGLEPKRLRFVQQRRDKAPFLFLAEAARGGKPGLRVEPALLVEAESGSWSEEMLAVYGEYKENHQ